MWFAFPEGVDCISVELQEYHSEVEHDGTRYFRAPDHFAAKILDLSGFKHQIPPQEANPPEDIPRGEVLTADAQNAALLSGRVNALELERDEARARLAEVSAERDSLKLKLHETEADVADLKEELTNLRSELEASQAKRKAS